MLHCVADVPQWDPDAGGPAYVYMRVADHIAARIAAGDLPAEARLPAERDLAAEYAVAIGTARRAVLELRDRGLVVTLPGKGTYVVSPPKSMSEARSLRSTGEAVRAAAPGRRGDISRRFSRRSGP
jgi:DNA-binding GntR family transcriptional regulator